MKNLQLHTTLKIIKIIQIQQNKDHYLMTIL